MKKHKQEHTARAGEALSEEQSASSDSASRKSTSYRNEALVGLAAILAIVAGVLGVRYMKGTPLFSDAYTLVADFENADGLTEGTAVTVSGLKIGTVKDIRLTNGGRQVRARLRLGEEVHVPEGSVAEVAGVSALGNVSVAVDLGPPGRSPLADGATIPTVSEGPLEGFSEQVRPLAGRLDSTLTSAGGAFRETEQLVAGSQGDMHATIQHMREASATASALLEEQRGPLRGATANLDTLTAELSDLAGRLDQYTKGAGGDSLAAVVAGMNRTLRETRRATASLQRGGDALETLLRGINRGEGTLGRLANDPSLYVRLDSAALRLDRILADFQQNPGRYLERMQLVDLF